MLTIIGQYKNDSYILTQYVNKNTSELAQFYTIDLHYLNAL